MMSLLVGRENFKVMLNQHLIVSFLFMNKPYFHYLKRTQTELTQFIKANLAKASASVFLSYMVKRNRWKEKVDCVYDKFISRSSEFKSCAEQTFDGRFSLLHMQVVKFYESNDLKTNVYIYIYIHKNNVVLDF